MSKPPFQTRYVSNNSKTVAQAYKIKALTAEHETLQRELMEKFKAEAIALTNKMQGKMNEVFAVMTVDMGIPPEDYAEGFNWAMNIENLDQGEVAMVHRLHQPIVEDCLCDQCVMDMAMGRPSRPKGHAPINPGKPDRVH